MFHPLTNEDIREILLLQIDGLKKKMAEMGVEIQFSESSIKYLSQKGYDPAYGARPIKRVLQRELVNQLAKALLEGSIDKEKRVLVDSAGEELIFKN